MPNTIGRYQIIDLIGTGGMASVYRGYDPHFDREVAVKVIAAHFMHNNELRERFKQEAKLIAALEHPAIVPVYDFGEENGQPFLVMRLMKGGSLKNWLGQGPLSLHQTIYLLERLAVALDTAHRYGIVHRDIKPDNILFDDANHPYIADFGVAKLVAQTSLGLTQSGSPIGSPPYMSPEQARGVTQIDGRSDIYSLGVLLFELLAGQRPYQADSVTGYIYQHISQPVPNIRHINPRLPQACQNIILRAMAKEPTQRYNSASQMVAELKRIAHTTNTDQIKRENGKPWWRLAALVAGGIGVVFILCMVITLALVVNGFGRTATPRFTPTPAFTPTPNANFYIEQGDSLRNSGQHEEAIAAYTRAINLDPNNTDAYFGRGFSHQEISQFDLAIADYTNLIRLDPDYPDAFNNRGVAYQSKGELDLAIADYGQAIRVNADNVLAYGNRGNVYLEQGRLDLAIADFNEALRIDPDYAPAYNDRGVAYQRKGERQLAIADYRKALELDNDATATKLARENLQNLGVEP